MRTTGRNMGKAGSGPILWCVAGLALAGTLLVAMPAAAVQARAEWRRDLKRIIDLEVFDELGPIERIERIQHHSWRVTTARCTVEVYFIERRLRPDMPNYRPIPPTWELRAQRPVCRR